MDSKGEQNSPRYALEMIVKLYLIFYSQALRILTPWRPP